ncbi:MAG: lysylphosphatidylglycerol synthase transmembrane domain-containing protein [Dehalococcoidia bacterium]
MAGSRLFGVVRLVVSLAIVAGLIYKLSPGDLRGTVRDADPWLLAAATALLAAVQLLVVLKWAALLRGRGVRPRAALLVRIFAQANLLTNILPTGFGGDPYRVYRLQREAGASAADVTMSVLFERATGYGAMTCFGALGAAFHYGNALAGLLALAAGVAGGGVLAFALPRMPVPAIRHDHPVRRVLASRAEMLMLYRMLVFSLVIQALYISTIALTGGAFGIHLSWGYWAMTTWIVAVAVLAPITLGGLGVRESSFAALVSRGGGTNVQGAAVGFSLAVMLSVVSAGLLVGVEAAERLGYVRRPAAVPDAGAVEVRG